MTARLAYGLANEVNNMETKQFEVAQERVAQERVHSYRMGWYTVYVSWHPQASTPVVDLLKLAECLPHGSGIDGSWYLTVRRNGDVGVMGEYHTMNDMGYYTGWINFRFALSKCRKCKFQQLSGPMTGKVQVTKRKGTVYLESFRGGGQNHGDYLYDVCSHAISVAMGVTAISSEIMSEKDAQTLGYM